VIPARLFSVEDCWNVGCQTGLQDLLDIGDASRHTRYDFCVFQNLESFILRHEGIFAKLPPKIQEVTEPPTRIVMTSRA